jgi:hypothetical protein
MFDPDEMRDALEKAKVSATSRNSLVNEYLRLYEGNRTGNRARGTGKQQLDDCHFAILGGATPESYQNMWTGTGGGSTGLQSRFVVIDTDAPKLPIKRTPSDPVKLAAVYKRLLAQAKLPPQTISYAPEAWQLLESWWGTGRDKISEIRIDDFCKRLVLVLAPTNDATVISVELVKQAIEFGDYVIAAREKHNPSGDAYTWTQGFEQDIVAIFKKQYETGVTAMTANEVRRLVRPERKPGGHGSYKQAWGNLIGTGVIKQESTTAHNTGRYEYRG